MSTIVVASVPAEQFALYRTLQAHEDIAVECERLVETGADAVVPLVWATGPDEETVRAALEADPTTTDVELLSSFDGEWLYRMEWVDRVGVVLQMIANSEATIMEAWTDRERWWFRVLFPTREGLSSTHDYCEINDLRFDIELVREMEGDPSGRYGLTTEQFDALVAACEAGYFAVPRETDLDELAEDLDISHQALSERLRRGQEALVTDTLLLGKKSLG
ncbi:helix-turn-helix domain-containing protein [Halomarina rubra]|uniref:Helix-turn-helix domain-containing protein n=1 Tax=Halomarina rubra TaxID=2071873 RepID=A0ABD6AR16_9EURY|nr:helix-turn-helix domain-containing protein [Halomarina rubra]